MRQGSQVPALTGHIGEELPLDGLGQRERVGLGFGREFPHERGVGEGTHAGLLPGQGLDTAGRSPEAKHGVPPEAVQGDIVASFGRSQPGMLQLVQNAGQVTSASCALIRRIPWDIDPRRSSKALWRATALQRKQTFVRC